MSLQEFIASRFPDDQRASARAAFGLFSPEQALRIFDRTVDSGFEPVVEQVAPRTWFVQPGMVNVGVFETDEGVVLVDCGCAGDGPALQRAVRSVTDQPLHTVIFTHGHIDHAFGLWAFLEAGERPQVVAHRNVVGHFERYRRTAELNARINGQIGVNGSVGWPSSAEDFCWPTRTYDDRLTLTVGGEQFVLQHAKGETDDATWVWLPERRVVATGDLVTGYLPNAGNPRKVQRYAEEWADAAEQIAALEPEVLITGHGEPVRGVAAINEELTAMAGYLRHIVRHTLDGLNAGRLPDEIVAALAVPAELRDHPRLPPLYDRPEFICRNVIRRYAGWWDGYPSHLLPASQDAQAREVVALAGGIEAVVARARELAPAEPELAGHLAEWAFLADRGHPDAQACYAEVFEQRAGSHISLMTQLNLRVAATWVAQAREAGPSRD